MARKKRAMSAGDDGDDVSQEDMTDLAFVNLANFDEENAEPPILTSPRSLEACKLLGLEPSDLIKRSLDYFISQAGPSEEPTFIAKRAARYEKTRQHHLRNARVQREELIDAELHGVHGGMSLYTRSLARSPLAAKLSIGKHSESTLQLHDREFTVLEREKRELERIRQRQAMEMQQLLQFELKMAEVHRERDLQEKAQRRRDEQAAKEKLKRQREADELARRKELERAEQERLEVEQARRQVQEQQRELQRKTEREEREKERRRREAQRSEKERLAKQEQLRLQAEQYQLQQQREVERKEQEIQRREQRRQRLLDHKTRQKALEIAEKQKQNRMRITNVLQDREMVRQQQLHEQERRIQESEERRRRFEEERRLREEEIREQAARKKDAIEMVQHQLSVIEQERRERLMEQERAVEQRLQIQDQEKQAAREQQKREERRLERERRRVYHRMEQQLQQRQEATLTKAAQKAAMAHAMQEKKTRTMRSRLHEAKLREEEIQASRARKEKADSYRVNLLLTRIESDNERARMIKEQREALIRHRHAIKLTAQRQKDELLERFHQMKITKKYDLPKHLQESLSLARPRSAAALQTHSLCSLSGASPHAKSMMRSSSHRSDLPKRPASAIARSSHKAGAWPSTASSRSQTSRSASRCDSELDDQELGVSQDDSEDAKDVQQNEELEELKRQQNDELLQLLQQEYHAEEQREYLLHQAQDTNERARLDKIFSTERTAASEHILMLTQQHEQVLAARLHAL